jgi:hypothetical protein
LIPITTSLVLRQSDPPRPTSPAVPVEPAAMENRQVIEWEGRY